MKKNLWMLGVAVAALTSCSQSEVLDIAESKTIQFDSFVGKQTKAVNDVGQTENFNVFYVYAAKGTTTNGVFTADSDGATFFDGQKVSRSKNTTGAWYDWSYANPKPWTIDKTYRFAAYANGYNTNGEEAKLTTGVAFNSKMEDVQTLDSEVTIEETWGLDFTNYSAAATDLIASVPAEEKRSTSVDLNKDVNLTFSHMLAKVEFKFVLNLDADEDLTVKVNPFTLNAIKTSDCKVYYNPNLTNLTTTNKTEVHWASQNVKATDDISDNTNHITTDDYVVIAENNPIVLTKSNDDDSDGPENIKSVAFYVIPQSNDITVSFDGDSYSSSEMTSETQIGSTHFDDISLKIDTHDKWLPGYVYRYVANLNPQVNYITFEASVEAWNDESGRDQGIVGSSSSTSDSGSGS